MNANDLVTAWDEERTLAEWCHLADLGRRIVQTRLNRGLPLEVALSIPKQGHVDESAPPGYPNAWTWHALAFEDDDWAREFTRRNDRGAPMEAVAEAIGVTYNAVRIIERRAIAKLKAIHGPHVLRQVLRGAM